jgi:hypothetical protein
MYARVVDRYFLWTEPGVDLAQALPLIPSAGLCAPVVDGENLVGPHNTDNSSEIVLLRACAVEPASEEASSLDLARNFAPRDSAFPEPRKKRWDFPENVVNCCIWSGGWM